MSGLEKGVVNGTEVDIRHVARLCGKNIRRGNGAFWCETEASPYFKLALLQYSMSCALCFVTCGCYGFTPPRPNDHDAGRFSICGTRSTRISHLVQHEEKKKNDYSNPVGLSASRCKFIEEHLCFLTVRQYGGNINYPLA